jgi:hypothetical protein
MSMTRDAVLQAFPLIRAVYPLMSLEQWQKRLSFLMDNGCHNGAIVALRCGYVRGVFTFALAPAEEGATRLEIRDLCVMDMLEGDDVLMALVECMKDKSRTLGASDSLVYLTPEQKVEAHKLQREGLQTCTLCGEALSEELPSNRTDKILSR